MNEKVPPRSIQISLPDWELMHKDVSERQAEEACGILAGQFTDEHYQVAGVFTATNLFHSPTRYRIDPLEQLAIFNQIDTLGLEMVGIYHSHPNGPGYPSLTDIAEAYYPEAAYLIWFKHNEVWSCSAFIINKSDVKEIEIQKIESQK
jgi:proteasome lid subunit RPN8/RPN11